VPRAMGTRVFEVGSLVAITFVFMISVSQTPLSTFVAWGDLVVSGVLVGGATSRSSRVISGQSQMQ
jgi:hypothetical protein